MNYRNALSGFSNAFFTLAITALVSCPALCQAETPKAIAVESKSSTLLQRIVVIGASASAGFTMSEPLGGTNSLKLRLDRYLDAAIAAPHEPIQNFASTMFFMQPEAQAKQQIDRVLRVKPTLVATPDFLFWFCYGEGTNDAHRLSRFEYGLKLLETIPCPVVVGDIPDCSAAVNGILDPGEVPSTNAIRNANVRLKEWAKTHPCVTIAPVAAFLETATAGKPSQIHDETISAHDARRLLQADRVHPTPMGAAVLALIVLDAAQRGGASITTNEVSWNYKEVLRLGLNASASPTASQTKSNPSSESKQNLSETAPGVERKPKL